MNWLTFLAICIVVIPWQVLSAIVVINVIKYIDMVLAVKNNPVGFQLLINQVSEQLRTNASYDEIWKLVSEYMFGTTVTPLVTPTTPLTPQRKPLLRREGNITESFINT